MMTLPLAYSARRDMRATRVTRHIDARRSKVYAAVIDPDAVSKWKFPTGMTIRVHQFEPREGGAIRISLTYETETDAGKTEANTDTYRGRFLELVPDERVVEVDEFETSDPALQGEMRITITLADDGGGTEVTGLHEGLPDGISLSDNEEGWRSALERLAALVETG